MIDTIKSMYDSLVRTYTPMIAGALLGWLATLLPIIPPEFESGLVILIGLLFQLVWYFIGRLLETVRGKASPLLTLGLVKNDPPVYGTVIAEPAPDVVLVETANNPTTPS